MPRPPRNPFYAVLGIVGFAFTVTAAASCVAVLRGVRPVTDTGGSHLLDALMARYGTSLLVGEIAVLAVATVGAIWLDHLAGERVRRERAASQAAEPGAADAGADEP
jgi:multisubunit Na+/H+ antiporter MnhB subunit